MSLHSIKKDLQLKQQRELNDLNEISEDVWLISESHELNLFWLLIVQTIVYTFDIVRLISSISQVHLLILHKEWGGGGDDCGFIFPNIGW